MQSMAVYYVPDQGEQTSAAGSRCLRQAESARVELVPFPGCSLDVAACSLFVPFCSLDAIEGVSPRAQTPSAPLIAPAIPFVSVFIFSSDSASTITRANASVPE
jgi:hypothetical protein